MQQPDDTLDLATQHLFRPETWPLLDQPVNAVDFGRCLLEVMRTEAGRLVLNGLVVTYLLKRPEGDVSAERAEGRADVVRDLLEMLGLGLSRQPVAQGPVYTNPWRDK